MKYLKEYKNFIPIDVYEKRSKSEDEKLKTIIIIVLLGNIIFFFMSVDKVKTIKENINIIEYSFNEKRERSIDEIEKWINLLEYSSESGSIENNKGTIKLLNEDIEKIKEKANIKSIKDKDKSLIIKVEEIK